MSLPEAVHDLAITYERGEMTLELHPVAVETDHGIVLVDVGLPGAVSEISEAFEEAGLGLEAVETVLLTHHDGDHAGALAELDVDRTLCYHGGVVDDGSDRIAEIASDS